MRSLIGRAFRSQPQDGGVGWADPSAIPPNSAFSRQLAGVLVNEHTALQLMSVMSCIRLISGLVGRLPLGSYVTENGVRSPVAPAPAIVARPFGGVVSRREGIRMGVISLMLRGNAYYLVLARDATGYPLQLLPLPVQSVAVKMVNGQATYYVNHTLVPSADVLHLRWITLPGGIVGLSPIEYAAQGLGINLAAEEYGARFFQQGATVSGVLESDKTLTKDTVRRVAQDFANTHGGLAQSHLPLVLDGGLKWSGVSLPPDQAQFLATREFQRGEIAMLFGVPPHLIGDTDKTTSWGKGIQDQKIDFLTFTIEDYTSIFEDAWNEITPPPADCRFNYDALLRTNTVDRYNTYMAARVAGFMNNEEIRALEDLQPSGNPALSDYAQPLNSAPTPITGDKDTSASV